MLRLCRYARHEGEAGQADVRQHAGGEGRPDEQGVGRTGHARQERQDAPNDAAGGHSPSAGRLRTQRLEPERGNARAGKHQERGGDDEDGAMDAGPQ